jgi:N-acetylneuraminic acid mutarotase
MIVWGGFNGTTRIPYGYFYDLTTDTWSTRQTNVLASSPGLRVYTEGHWTGSEYLIWGGYDGAVLNTGFRYDPVTDVWKRMSTTNAPEARRIFSQVIAGDKYFVWGGNNATVRVNTGAVYDIPTDTWTATTTTGALSARNALAFWSGTEVLIWGGTAGSTFYANGARYNIATDTWTAMAASPLAARSGPAIAWSGSELLVWGGITAAGPPAVYNGTGARYNPTTNTWTAMSTTGALTARSGVNQVWTGSKWFMWSGTNLSSGAIGEVTGGALYDPSNDTWTSIAEPSLTPRRLAQIVWTGTEVIVWGGYDRASTSTSFGDGARYNPTTDSWTTMGTGFSGRYQGNPAWTGSELIIFGGGHGTSLYGDFGGGRYIP